jgi:hypothetical protein
MIRSYKKTLTITADEIPIECYPSLQFKLDSPRDGHSVKIYNETWSYLMSMKVAKEFIEKYKDSIKYVNLQRLIIFIKNEIVGVQTQIRLSPYDFKYPKKTITTSYGREYVTDDYSKNPHRTRVLPINEEIEILWDYYRVTNKVAEYEEIDFTFKNIYYFIKFLKKYKQELFEAIIMDKTHYRTLVIMKTQEEQNANRILTNM